MKNITLPALCLLFAFASYAQDTTMIYYDITWKETTKDKAEYGRKKFISGDHWGVVDYYYKTSKFQMTGMFTNDSCTVKDGLFEWYDAKGFVSHSAYYTAGKVNGQDVLYYESGKKKTEGNYKMGKMDGDWLGYYENGQMSAKAHFTEDEQSSADFFNADGTPNRNIKVFFQDAEFPGGLRALGKYLYHSITYPIDAQKNSVQGTVVVQFIVKKDGSLANINIAKSVYPSLDAEALRVVKAMPSWTPAIIGGILTDYYLKQPVTFKLENN